MAQQGSEEETTITKSHQQLISSTGTLTSPTLLDIPPLPTLPFDVQSDILCRLPVKLLVQLRCLSKSYNSLISDPKFAKKHLRLSTKRHNLMMISSNKERPSLVAMYDSLLTSAFAASAVPQTQLNYLTLHYGHLTKLCSCDGIFCVTTDNMSIILWNPSLRKHKILPPLDKSWNYKFGFGYDRVIDNYKTIVVCSKNEVSVNVLGTDYWRKMLDFPHDLFIIEFGWGKFVNGTVNWLACKKSVLSDSVNEISDWNPFSTLFILSLDLEKEWYQEFPKPDLVMDSWNLGVVKDCLCIFAKSEMFLDVWIMKEFGNKESWTKLYSVPDMRHQGLDASSVLHISEDDRLLVDFYGISSSNIELVVYDPKNGTLNISEFQNKCSFKPQVYIESLIAP